MRILITFILSFSILACPDYQRLKSGSAAPCNGHFFNDSTELSIRKDVRDNKLLKKQVTLKDLQINQLTEDRDNWKKEANKQSKVSHNKDSDLTKGFVGGIGLTLLVMFLGKKVSK